MPKQPKVIRVVAVQDESGHWYVIPESEHETFNWFLGRGEEAEYEFNERFSSYATGGDLNLVPLYASI